MSLGQETHEGVRYAIVYESTHPSFHSPPLSLEFKNPSANEKYAKGLAGPRPNLRYLFAFHHFFNTLAAPAKPPSEGGLL